MKSLWVAVSLLISSVSFGGPNSPSAKTRFCAGGWRDISKFSSFLAQLDAERAFDGSWQRIMLIEGSQHNIRFPDEAAIRLAKFAGFRDDNQYYWAVQTTCGDWKIEFR